LKDQEAQIAIQAAMDALVASGAETGIQVAVMKNGRVVVDVGVRRSARSSSCA
jgi:5,10-methylene-tetrahydrofolate dehydrogenase/methenyl tetrahydrofolate cyclohydrolase